MIEKKHLFGNCSRVQFLALVPTLLLASLLLGKQGQAGQLTLHQAVETALKNNLNLRLKKEEIEAAGGAVMIEKGAFDTLFKAEASAAKEEMIPLAPNSASEEQKSIWQLGAEKRFTTGTLLGVGWNNNRYRNDLDGLFLNPALHSGFSITVQQPLLKGAGAERQQAGQYAAEKVMQAAEFDSANEAAELAAKVKKAYWQLVFTRENLKAEQLSLRLAEQLLDETREQIEAGRRAEIDIYQPQAEIALRSQELIAAEKAIGEAEDSLKLLMGVQTASDWDENYLPADSPQTDLAPRDINQLIETALRNRADIQAAQRQIEAAEYRLTQTKDTLRPAFDLIGGYSLAGTSDTYSSSITASIENPQQSWNLGLRFTMPLHNDSARGAMQQARARKMQGQTALELLRQQIQLEIRTALRDIRLAAKTLAAAQKTTFASKKQLEAERVRFDAGRATTFDVLLAQQKYAAALSRQALSEAGCAIAIAELERIQGAIFSDNRGDTPSYQEENQHLF